MHPKATPGCQVGVDQTSWQVRLEFTEFRLPIVMNRIHWRSVSRAALVLSCATFFATITVIGQVADPQPVSQTPTHFINAGR